MGEHLDRIIFLFPWNNTQHLYLKKSRWMCIIIPSKYFGDPSTELLLLIDRLKILGEINNLPPMFQ